jgi:hypothetical protein
MFRCIGVQAYENGRGHRFTFQVEESIFLRRGKGLPRIFVPKGGQVEVSLVNLPLILGDREIAVIYGGEFITFRRGPTLTAEGVLREVGVKQRG